MQAFLKSLNHNVVLVNIVLMLLITLALLTGLGSQLLKLQFKFIPIFINRNVFYALVFQELLIHLQLLRNFDSQICYFWSVVTQLVQFVKAGQAYLSVGVRRKSGLFWRFDLNYFWLRLRLLKVLSAARSSYWSLVTHRFFDRGLFLQIKLNNLSFFVLVLHRNRLFLLFWSRTYPRAEFWFRDLTLLFHLVVSRCISLVALSLVNIIAYHGRKPVKLWVIQNVFRKLRRCCVLNSLLFLSNCLW